ncbi:hypothetical protein TNCV_2259121 [Trichonephila clavipes]|nr:hypothetical protein TNCV_2259121 [Trichonephila clavipes]
MTRRKQLSSLDQVSEFDRERIVAYPDCGLPSGKSVVVLDETKQRMHCRNFKQPAQHLRDVGAICPSLHSGLGLSHISTGQYATTRGTHCLKNLREVPD